MKLMGYSEWNTAKFNWIWVYLFLPVGIGLHTDIPCCVIYKDAACKNKLSEVGHLCSDCIYKCGPCQTTSNEAPQWGSPTWSLSVIFSRKWGTFGFLPRPREILYACWICILILSLITMTLPAHIVGALCKECSGRCSQAYFLSLQFLRDHRAQWPACIGALSGSETFQVSWQQLSVIDKSVHVCSEREGSVSRWKARIVICCLITASESLPHNRQVPVTDRRISPAPKLKQWKRGTWKK